MNLKLQVWKARYIFTFKKPTWNHPKTVRLIKRRLGTDSRPKNCKHTQRKKKRIALNTIQIPCRCVPSWCFLVRGCRRHLLRPASVKADHSRSCGSLTAPTIVALHLRRPWNNRRCVTQNDGGVVYRLPVYRRVHGLQVFCLCPSAVWLCSGAARRTSVAALTGGRINSVLYKFGLKKRFHLWGGKEE